MRTSVTKSKTDPTREASREKENKFHSSKIVATREPLYRRIFRFLVYAAMLTGGYSFGKRSISSNTGSVIPAPCTIYGLIGDDGSVRFKNALMASNPGFSSQHRVA